jgi:hypothetical protein
MVVAAVAGEAEAAPTVAEEAQGRNHTTDLELVDEAARAEARIEDGTAAGRKRSWKEEEAAELAEELAELAEEAAAAEQQQQQQQQHQQ